MEENLKWVWIAFSIAWVLHLLYVASLASRQKSLRRQIDDLKAQVEEHEGGS